MPIMGEGRTEAAIKQKKLVTRTSHFTTGIPIYEDNFDVLKWATDNIQGVGAVALDATKLHPLMSGGNALKISTGSALNDQTGAYKMLPFPHSQIMAFEGNLYIDDPTGHSCVLIRIYLKDGSVITGLHIRWKASDGSINYVNSTGADVKIGTLTYPTYQNVKFKLIIDIIRKEYVALYFAGVRYNLKDISGEAGGATTAKVINIGIYLINGTATAARSVWLSDPVVTIHDQD